LQAGLWPGSRKRDMEEEEKPEKSVPEQEEHQEMKLEPEKSVPEQEEDQEMKLEPEKSVPEPDKDEDYCKVSVEEACNAKEEITAGKGKGKGEGKGKGKGKKSDEDANNEVVLKRKGRPGKVYP